MPRPSLPLRGMIVLRRSGAIATDHPNVLGDVIALVGPSTYGLPRSLPKSQAEDIQMASFASALALAEGIDSSKIGWTRGVDQDAPDITVTVDDHSIEVELTTLTAGALRAERRRLSEVAENLRDALAGQNDLNTALSGCTVELSDAAELPMPPMTGAPATAARITGLLAAFASVHADVAQATIAEEVRVTANPAAHSPAAIDGIRVRLVSDRTPGIRIVTRASQATITLSEARRKLSDRLLDKNSKLRENVVICAGDPDRDGVVLPLDVTEFELLAIFGCGELPAHSPGEAGMASLGRHH